MIFVRYLDLMLKPNIIEIFEFNVVKFILKNFYLKHDSDTPGKLEKIRFLQFLNAGFS